MTDKPPNPGSDEAAALGCTCPRMDNAYGRGRGRGGMGEKFGWWIHGDCKLHGKALIPGLDPAFAVDGDPAVAVDGDSDIEEGA